MRTLIIATRNRHKVGEIRAVLGEGAAYRTLADWPGAPEIAEDGDTFAANARKKALGLAAWLAGQPEFCSAEPAWVLADDSGLEVDALDGAPGVHSARFAVLETGAAGNAPDAANNALLLRRLKGLPRDRRTAWFRCAIAVVPVKRPAPEAGEVELFAGACEGRILEAPRGEAGFGYDPLFQPRGYEDSFAELGERVKNGISHRARALEQMAGWWARQSG